MRKLVILCLLTICCGMARGQTIEDVLAALPPATKAERVRYWFDDDPTSIATLQQMQGELQIDASALVEGLHTLQGRKYGAQTGRERGIQAHLPFTPGHPS